MQTSFADHYQKLETFMTKWKEEAFQLFGASFSKPDSSIGLTCDDSFRVAVVPDREPFNLGFYSYVDVKNAKQPSADFGFDHFSIKTVVVEVLEYRAAEDVVVFAPVTNSDKKQIASRDFFEQFCTPVSAPAVLNK